jgi:regulator of protease activity HflC (stomatin/prohibitin superfamily)
MGIPGLPSGFVFLIIFLILLAASAIKIPREYERGVIFRLGRLIGAMQRDGRKWS